MMRCVVCGKGPMDSPPTTVYRCNPKGEGGIWACEDHNLDVEQAVKELAHVLEKING